MGFGLAHYGGDVRRARRVPSRQGSVPAPPLQRTRESVPRSGEAGKDREEVYHVSNFEQIQRLADRYISDPAFRSEMASDPEGTAKRHGVNLDETTRQTLRGIDWAGQALPGRVSKYAARWC